MRQMSAVLCSRNNEESMNFLRSTSQGEAPSRCYSIQMRYLVSVLLLTFFTIGLTANPNPKAGHAPRGAAKSGKDTSQSSALEKLRMQQSYAKQPLRFEPNLGQSDSRVKFLSRGSGYTLFLGHEEATLSLSHPSSHQAPQQSIPEASQKAHPAPSTTAVLRMQFLGAAS